MTHGTATIGTTGYATDIVVGGHHRLIADEPVAGGGTDAGPAPYDLLVASLGACTAITLRMYADRKGWKIYSLTVDLRIERGNDGMRIERALTIDGLGDDQKARLAEIAEKTPITLTLKGGIPIHTTLA